MTRDEVLSVLDRSRRQVEERVTEGLTERFHELSAKDLLFHLSSWQGFFVARLKARREDGREATASDLVGMTLDPDQSDRLLKLDTDETNAYIQDRYRETGWIEARSYWADSCDRLRDEVARLSDQQLAEGEPPLWKTIGEESFSHVPLHLAAPEKTVG